MLQELYQLQDTLQEIYAARCFNNNQNPTSPSASSVNRYHHHQEEEEYYEEEDEDDYDSYFYDDDDDENDRHRGYGSAATVATRRLALSGNNATTIRFSVFRSQMLSDIFLSRLCQVTNSEILSYFPFETNY